VLNFERKLSINTPTMNPKTIRLRAFRGKPGGGGTSHTATQAAPIQLGTSGGWRKDLANGDCCGGTLGSLIQVNGVQYILSNYERSDSDRLPERSEGFNLYA
jgi:hypothetical protein